MRCNQIKSFRQHSRKLGGAAEHLIDGSEKRICRLSFEFKSPHVIEKRSNSCVPAEIVLFLHMINPFLTKLVRSRRLHSGLILFLHACGQNTQKTNLKFKAQPTNAFFATVNQMFGGSSQLPTTTERAVIKSNRLDNIVGSWEEPPNS